jgi:hypothetical protein
MSWQAIDAAYRTGADLDRAAKAVLVAIAYHANRQGRAWPSVATLCRDTGYGQAAVRRAIHRLTESGHLTVIHKPGTALILDMTALIVDVDRAHPERGNRKEPQRTSAPPRAATEGGDGAYHDPGAIAACSYCDEFGWLWRGNTIRGRCSHRPTRATTSLT